MRRLVLAVCDDLRRRLPDLRRERFEDWQLDDPAGKDVDTVRRVRDDIRGRVETLITELLPTGA
jgi:protein-tyrosine-phosphatase